MRRSLVAVMLLVALSLLACTSNKSRTSEDASSTSSPTKVGGMTECTIEAVQPFVTAYVQAADARNQMPIQDLQCSKGWAVASGILGPKDAPVGGPQGAPTSVIAEAEGQFWIIKDKAKVCGTFNADQPEAIPTDAEIPATLYTAGCLAG